MNPTPPDWPRISSALYYEDANKAIDWLCKAFGFELRLKVEGEGGSVEHSELVFGGGVIMVSSPGGAKATKYPYRASPQQVGGKCTQNLFVYVDDVDAHCKRAREAGATITDEPTTSDYGEDYWSDRNYGCTDLDGHHWWFAQRMRNKKT